MARYSATWTTVTAAALADTVAATNATYPGSLRGGGASVLGKINEVEIGGEDTASTPTTFILARSSTLSVGALSVGNNALMDVQSTAPGTIFNWQRSTCCPCPATPSAASAGGKPVTVRKSPCSAPRRMRARFCSRPRRVRGRARATSFTKWCN
jgi:hypothetical protein